MHTRYVHVYIPKAKIRIYTCTSTCRHRQPNPTRPPKPPHPASKTATHGQSQTSPQYSTCTRAPTTAVALDSLAGWSEDWSGPKGGPLYGIEAGAPTVAFSVGGPFVPCSSVLRFGPGRVRAGAGQGQCLRLRCSEARFRGVWCLADGGNFMPCVLGVR